MRFVVVTVSVQKLQIGIEVIPSLRSLSQSRHYSLRELIADAALDMSQ
ncbi:hypothetical protein NDA01_25755 [Trichocoleus desertorum AS-A10]